MVVDEELCMLHERLNVLLNRVRVLSLGEGLDEDALTLAGLHLLYAFSIHVELLEEFKCAVWMTICRLEIIE